MTQAQLEPLLPGAGRDDGDGASPAASLDAAMVRRGRDPWRGDETPASAAARPTRASVTAARDSRFERPSIRDRLPVGWQRDVVVFVAVFTVSAAAMIVLSMGAD